MSFERPHGATRFQTLSAQRSPLPSAELDGEFNELVEALNSFTVDEQQSSEWFDPDLPCAYVNATTFVVAGDKTDIYPVTIRVKITCSTTDYSEVLTSTYSAGSGNTTVVLKDSILSDPVTKALVSVTKPIANNGSITPQMIQAQPYDALLAAMAALTTAADKMIYATGADAVALCDVTAFARTLLDDADAVSMRTTLGATSVEDAQDAAASLFTSGAHTGISFTYDDAANTLSASLNPITNYQVFTASGTWLKPSVGAMVFIQVWGGGASGSDGDSGSVGGGAGQYRNVIRRAADLPASLSVTVGAERVAASGVYYPGFSGNSSSCNIVYAEGGVVHAGGVYSGVSAELGGAGGSQSVAGTAPGGGGGGTIYSYGNTNGGAAGNGARGEVRITVW